MSDRHVGAKVPEPCEECGASAVYVTITGTSCDWCGHRTATNRKWWWFR